MTDTSILGTQRRFYGDTKTGDAKTGDGSTKTGDGSMSLQMFLFMI